jgi:hypothetical protein
MTVNHNYQVRRAVYPNDRAAVIGLWKGNLGDPRRGAEKFAWFYENAPTGEPLSMLLSHGADLTDATWELAGVATAGARQWLIDDQPVVAGVLVDMTVTAAHRTLFPALALQKGLRKEGLALWQMLYGFPNPKAAPVFARVGYKKLGGIVRYACVLRTASYLSAKVPTPLATIAAPVADRFLSLRRRLRAGMGNGYRLRWGPLSEAALETNTTELPATELPASERLARGARDATFLRWRFADRGSLRFEFVSVDARGQQLGWWVVCAVGVTLHVCDCSITLLTLPDAHRMWIQLAKQARSKGFSSLSFACLAPEALIATLLRADMVAREQRPVFATSNATLPTSWFLTPADEDE